MRQMRMYILTASSSKILSDLRGLCTNLFTSNYVLNMILKGHQVQSKACYNACFSSGAEMVSISFFSPIQMILSSLILLHTVDKLSIPYITVP